MTSSSGPITGRNSGIRSIGDTSQTPAMATATFALLGTRISIIDYLQLRNTLLLVREHSGRYHATIRFLLAIGQLVGGLASPARRGPYWDPKARVQALVDHARGRYGAPPLWIQERTITGRSPRGGPAQRGPG